MSVSNSNFYYSELVSKDVTNYILTEIVAIELFQQSLVPFRRDSSDKVGHGCTTRGIIVK